MLQSRTRRLAASPGRDCSLDEEFPVASSRLRFANEPDPYQAWGGTEGLVGKFVRVYWPVEEQWYDGTVAGWDPKKRKHKYVTLPPQCATRGKRNLWLMYVCLHAHWLSGSNTQMRTGSGFRWPKIGTVSRFGTSCLAKRYALSEAV